MGGLLVQHAIDNIWCEPTQDRQEIIALAKLTDGSVSKRFTVIWDSIPLPSVVGNSRPFFHVYQIGAIDPSYFDVMMSKNIWYNAVDITEDSQVVLDVFFRNGIKVPSSYIYLRQNKNGDFIVAILSKPTTDYRLSDLDKDQLYIRLYANARFDSVEYRANASTYTTGLKVFSITVSMEGDISALLVTVNAHIAAYGGGGVWQLDGVMISTPAGYTNALMGKVLSFYWDTTIENVFSVPLATTPTFISQLDINKVKYLILPDKSYTSIDFFDDTDVYLTRSIAGGYEGVLLPRFQPVTMRQITHNGYSLDKISIDYILGLMGWTEPVTVKLVVRTGGFVKGLTHQLNRIEDLYRLTYSDILTAMTTVTAMPEWSAAVLENSKYVEIMRSENSAINTAMTEEAYGYNAATRAIANPILPVTPTPIPHVNLSKLLTTPDKNTGDGLRSIYFYEDGLFLGYINDNTKNATLYVPPPFASSEFVEAFNYNTTPNVSGVIYDADVSDESLRQYGFRCYACPIVSGQPSEVWSDITDTAYYYYSDDGVPTITWDFNLLSAANLFPAVKINNSIYYMEHTLAAPYDGLIQVQLMEDTILYNNPVTKPYKLQAGVIDVFMDGYSLVRNLDYSVISGLVTIFKRPLTDPIDTLIAVRSYGFANPATMDYYNHREFDFVRGGILSVDGRYNIRNDRNVRTVVSGRVMLRDSVSYAEDSIGALTTDGRPYAISDYIVGVENFTTKTLIPYRAEAMDRDERVMDYLTSKLPEATVRYPTIQIDRWELVSPFCSVILHALIDGLFNDGRLAGNYTGTTVDGWLAPYLPILAADPCLLNMNSSYVVIRPHQYDSVVSVDTDQYRFLEFIISRYLNNQTDLTSTVFIE